MREGTRVGEEDYRQGFPRINKINIQLGAEMEAQIKYCLYLFIKDRKASEKGS